MGFVHRDGETTVIVADMQGDYIKAIHNLYKERNAKIM